MSSAIRLLIRCAIHNEFERQQIIACPECGHQYKSETEVIRLFNEIDESDNKHGPSKPARHIMEVTFCPLCLHDW